jgi:hypothetical protein
MPFAYQPLCFGKMQKIWSHCLVLPRCQVLILLLLITTNSTFCQLHDCNRLCMQRLGYCRRGSCAELRYALQLKGLRASCGAYSTSRAVWSFSHPRHTVSMLPNATHKPGGCLAALLKPQKLSREMIDASTHFGTGRKWFQLQIISIKSKNYRARSLHAYTWQFSCDAAGISGLLS